MSEQQSIELNARVCAEVALYMWESYIDAMQQPRFSHPSFEDWPQQIIDRSDRE